MPQRELDPPYVSHYYEIYEALLFPKHFSNTFDNAILVLNRY